MDLCFLSRSCTDLFENEYVQIGKKGQCLVLVFIPIFFFFLWKCFVELYFLHEILFIVH